MSKHLMRFLLLVVLLSSLLLGQVFLVNAQKLATPPQQQATPTKEVLDTNAVQLPFRLIQEEDIALNGPYDAAYFTFAIPNNWALSPDAQLYLSMTVSFSKTLYTEFDYPVVAGGGMLTVYMNDTLLTTLQLDEAGEVEATMPIPIEAFISNRDDGRMAFYAELDAGDFCYVDDEFSLFIHPASYFYLPHEIVKPQVDLTKFPGIIYQGTFVQESALIVVPDKPSAAELQSALTVASGLGNFSQNELPIDITTISALTSGQKTANHLILVGKALSLNMDGLELPLKPVNGQFQDFGGNPDDGIVQLVNSPWNIGHVILLVSGNSDSGVVKAAQAVSTGILRSNRFNNLAVVEGIQLAQTSLTIPVMRTLAEMGYKNKIFDNRGLEATTYSFQVPTGWTITSDAYFELAFGNSSLVNYEQSGISIFLNGKPISSVRLDAETSKNPINKVRISIPESAIISGVNQLEIQVYLFPNDFCTPPDAQGLWVNIWDESLLNIPIIQQEVDLSTTVDLDEYPAPFILNTELNNTAFILPRDDLDAWRGAVKIASYVAFRTNSPIVTLSAFYGDEVPEDARAKYHMLLIGRPTQMPLLKEINQYLPVPFEENSDIALDSGLRVIYNVPDDVPLGYIELLTSPWNAENLIISILGNSQQGINLATAALVDDLLRAQVSGNYVIVNGTQIISTDTRLFPVSGGPTALAIETPAVPITPLDPESTMPQYQKLAWIPQAIMLALGLILLIIAIVVLKPILQKRARVKDQK